MAKSIPVRKVVFDTNLDMPDGAFIKQIDCNSVHKGIYELAYEPYFHAVVVRVIKPGANEGKTAMIGAGRCVWYPTPEPPQEPAK